MNNATYGFKLTQHAIQRLYERHPEIFADPYQQGKAKWDSAYKVLDDSDEFKAVLNNTSFMVYLYDTYGYDKSYKFFVNGDVLFVGIVEENDQRLIVTVMRCSEHSVKHLRHAPVQPEDRFVKKVRFRGKMRHWN